MQRIERAFQFKKSKLTNLMQFKRSRHEPVSGDIFVCNMLGKRWVAGRVIRHGFSNPSAKYCLLLYVYSHKFADPSSIKVPIAPNLLIPPFLMLSNMLWSRGMVAHIRNEHLRPEEVLSRHVFKTMMEKPYVDEESNPVARPKKNEYVGNYAFKGWGSFDEDISQALKVRAHPSHNDD